MLTPEPDERLAITSEYSPVGDSIRKGSLTNKSRLYTSSILTATTGSVASVASGRQRELPLMKKAKKVLARLVKNHRNLLKDTRKGGSTLIFGEPSVYHAAVVIFLEFFAWGLLTAPMITVLNKTFPEDTFLMNGIIMGIKGLLSFLSAPLLGALSDSWGRKTFLLVTVFFTCLPIPFMIISPGWYFGLISMSGVFAVTFSVVFAYVADITDETERSSAYGLVSATFAASLVTSPALGAFIGDVYGDEVVVALATAIAVLDVLFILSFVPESLPEKARFANASNFSWDVADPCSSLKKIGNDRVILIVCLTTFLSYLAEAGQVSCIFVYLRLVVGFTPEIVAAYIAFVGILSVLAQTALLTILMKHIGSKNTIVVALVFEAMQLAWYGFAQARWMMWGAGSLAAVCSLAYPAISAYVSNYTESDKQGLVQGIITGIRGLCNGLGPALYGLIFSLFHVNLSEATDKTLVATMRSLTLDLNATTTTALPSVEVDHHQNIRNTFIPGPAFVFGAIMVVCALGVAAFMPELVVCEKPRRPKMITPTMSFVAPDGEEDEDVEVYRKEGFSRVEGAPLIEFKNMPLEMPSSLGVLVLCVAIFCCQAVLPPPLPDIRRSNSLTTTTTTTTKVHTTAQPVVSSTTTTKKPATNHRNKTSISVKPFPRYGPCTTPYGAKPMDLPDIGLDYELELEGTLTDANLTYKTATFSDGPLQRGVVAIDLMDGRKEIILYDLKSATTFHVGDQNCTSEPLSRTVCNPLAYFMLRNLNSSSGSPACKFEPSKPVSLGAETVRGIPSHKWQHCLRLQNEGEKFLFRLTYFFRLNFFSSNPARQYIPVRLEVERFLHPYGAPEMSSTNASRQDVVFDFISFRSRLKNRSIFQAKEYSTCRGWNNTSSA
ncbi:Hippocampus abundant transcript 1 protein [Hypsibius exemplaris]|uniref:Hippocampus abundant transcript 1 protein n=1 Tax=Hypsibius exemplaris TaxID=2072580 RepID=A0A1W0WUT2_HYPEX|nr:Hippocampus abundant transcript 1 protein [Hypsibius exemplaris]